MQDSELKSVLKQVLTELGEKKASGDDLADSLLKKARSLRLSPEQLTRMVNVLNVERTLAMHSKAASDEERGADLHLLDAPSVVARYATETAPTEKKAGSIIRQVPMWKSYSVGDSLKSPPTAELLGAAGKLDDWQSSTAKAASAPDPLAWMKDDHGLRLLAADCNSELRTVLQKIARIALPSIISDPTPLLNEVTTLSPFVAEALGDHLQYLGYQVSRDKVAAVDFCPDTFKVEHLVREADELLHVGEVCKIAASPNSMAEMLSAAMQGGPARIVLADKVNMLGQPLEEPKEKEPDLPDIEESEKRPPSKPAGDMSPLLYALERSAPPAAARVEPNPYKEQGPSIAGSPSSDASQSKLLAALEAAGAAGSMVGTGGKALGEGAKGLADTLSKPYATEGAKSMTDLYTSLLGTSLTNKKQKVTDSVTRLKQQIVLTRLIKSDDIIRHAKPGEVVSMFNTIRNINPQAAADINVVKLLMREALTNQGMPLSSAKSLNDVQSSAKNTAK